MDKYDVVIIGSGTAGQTAAYELHAKGLTVAVVEKSDKPGGICALAGCQSKKWFYEGAEVIAKSHHLRDKGMLAPSAFAWADFLKEKNKFTDAVPGNTIKGFKKAGIDFILVGGVAAVAQGAPVTTFDLDIVHRRSEDNIKKLADYLKAINAIQRRPDDKIIKPDVRDLKGEGHVLLSTDLGPLDVLALIEDGCGYEELLPDSIKIEYQGYKISVLSLEAMVNMKRNPKYPEDEYRLQILQATLRQVKDDQD